MTKLHRTNTQGIEQILFCKIFDEQLIQKTKSYSSLKYKENQINKLNTKTPQKIIQNKQQRMCTYVFSVPPANSASSCVFKKMPG
jgi:hypothetical protein